MLQYFCRNELQKRHTRVLRLIKDLDTVLTELISNYNLLELFDYRLKSRLKDSANFRYYFS